MLSVDQTKKTPLSVVQQLRGKVDWGEPASHEGREKYDCVHNRESCRTVEITNLIVMAV